MKITEILQVDAALKAGLDLGHIFLETLQRAETAFVNLLASADQPGLRISGNLTIGHVASGDLSNLGDAEHRSDLGVTGDHVLVHGLQKAGQGFLDVLDELVDDVKEVKDDLVNQAKDAVGLNETEKKD